MTFKKYRGQIFDVELTKKEQAALDVEIDRQTIEHHREFTDDFDYMVLYILHNHFGFEPAELRRFHDAFIVDNEALIQHYEMPDAGVYIARKEMDAIGCNVKQWNEERSE